MTPESSETFFKGKLNHLDKWLRVRTDKTFPACLFLLLCYLPMSAALIRRHLWLDELATYYISGAPSFHRMFEALGSGIDYNPPLIYLITRAWQFIVGPDETLSRIPVAAAFFLASIGVFLFLKPRINSMWATCAVLMFWSTPSFYFATELRPYALVLMFFSFVLLGWDHSHEKNRRAALVCIFVGSLGLMLSHVLAVFALGAICLAELAGQIEQRHLHVPLWLCLLLPVTAIFSYIPFIHRFEGGVYPAAFQAGIHRFGAYLFNQGTGLWIPFVSAAIAALAVGFLQGRRLQYPVRVPRTREIWLTIGLLSLPLLLNGIMMLEHLPFFDRYALEASLTVCVLVIAALAYLSGFNYLAGLAALALLTIFGFERNLVIPIENQRRADLQPRLSQVQPANLPFVVSNGVIFLELDHYERPDFLARVVFLTDRNAAKRIAHSTLFDTIISLEKTYFPVRSQVEPYHDFVARHRRFLLLANPGWPEEWMLRKLAEDGAVLTRTSGWNDRYPIGGYVYDVRMPN